MKGKCLVCGKMTELEESGKGSTGVCNYGYCKQCLDSVDSVMMNPINMMNT